LDEGRGLDGFWGLGQGMVKRAIWLYNRSWIYDDGYDIREKLKRGLIGRVGDNMGWIYSEM